MAFRWFLCGLFILTTLSSLQADTTAVHQRPLPYKQGELIVTFKHRNAAKAVHRSVGGVVKTRLTRLKSDLVTLPASMSVKEAIRQYQSDPEVEYAEPNYIVHKAALPNDPLFPSQPNMLQISAPAAWDSFTGSRSNSSKIVAILDTGVDYTHPDLAANMWFNAAEIPGNGIDDDGNGIVDDYRGANFNNGLPTSGDPRDDDTADAHGTHIAGIVGAVGNNGSGVAGVNWNARIMAVKVLHGREGLGEAVDILKGIEYAIAKGASIINCSIEYPEVDEFGNSITASELKSLRDALQFANDSGILIVTAAGNRGKNLNLQHSYPASLQTRNNIAVAATDSSDLLASYSDYGDQVVHLAAPGGDAYNSSKGILSTVSNLTNEYGVPLLLLYRTTAGTSMSAPHVSGLAALLWNRYPQLTPSQVKARMMNSVDKLDSLTGKVISGGRINLTRALTTSELPAIFSITPPRVVPGTTVTAVGANFGAAGGNITVAGQPMTVASWSDTEITAVVPGSALSGQVMVNGLGSSIYLAVPAPPSVTLTAEPTTGAPPLDVKLQGIVQGEAVAISSYQWDLGDGDFITIPSVTTVLNHTFTTAGNYTLRLKVTDDLGQTAIATTSVSIGTAAAGTGGGGGGGCFIATAAYGSSLHPRVMALRMFRDNCLLTNLPGRIFVRCYYAISPPLADFIARHERLRSMARVMLTPLVWWAEWLQT